MRVMSIEKASKLLKDKEIQYFVNAKLCKMRQNFMAYGNEVVPLHKGDSVIVLSIDKSSCVVYIDDEFSIEINKAFVDCDNTVEIALV